MTTRDEMTGLLLALGSLENQLKIARERGDASRVRYLSTRHIPRMQHRIRVLRQQRQQYLLSKRTKHYE